MKIAIIVAMDKELEFLLPLISDKRNVKCDGMDIVEGRMGRHDVAVMKCGIGKVNAAISTSELVDMYHPDILINTGVAGGADSSMNVLDVFVADGVAYHDVWCGPDTIHGQAYGCPLIFKPSVPKELMAKLPESVKVGLICSGDKFITTEDEIKEIKSHFSEALAVDMESAAIAHVCDRKKVPFMVIRVVSDTPGQAENISQYENFWTDAPTRTFDALSSIIKSL